MPGCVLVLCIRGKLSTNQGIDWLYSEEDNHFGRFCRRIASVFGYDRFEPHKEDRTENQSAQSRLSDLSAHQFISQYETIIPDQCSIAYDNSVRTTQNGSCIPS